MSIPEQSGDSFDFCVLFRVYFTGKGAESSLQTVKEFEKAFFFSDKLPMHKKIALSDDSEKIFD